MITLVYSKRVSVRNNLLHSVPSYPPFQKISKISLHRCHAKGQLNSEWIYDVIVSSKIPVVQNNFGNKLPFKKKYEFTDLILNVNPQKFGFNRKEVQTGFFFSKVQVVWEVHKNELQLPLVFHIYFVNFKYSRNKIRNTQNEHLNTVCQNLNSQ